MSRFEHELRALGKRRIGLPELRAAYFRAHPEALDAPDGRRLLLEALQVLARDGVVELPGQGWDRSGSPALPRTARLRVDANPGGAPEPCAWLPALAFAGEERHPVRRRDLQAINAFLLAMRDRSLCSVPTRERSLQVFGDEKRLDDLRKGGSSLFEGRVSLDDLKCYPVAPPLPYETPEKPAPGKAILVLENYHSFDSFCRWNRKTALYAAVAYGSGNAFRQGRRQPRRRDGAHRRRWRRVRGRSGSRRRADTDRRQHAPAGGGTGGAAPTSRSVQMVAGAWLSAPIGRCTQGGAGSEAGGDLPDRRRERSRRALVGTRARSAGEFRPAATGRKGHGGCESGGRLKSPGGARRAASRCRARVTSPCRSSTACSPRPSAFTT